MSGTTDATLVSIEAKLAEAAVAGDRKTRVAVMRELMQGFAELAREVAAGKASWDELRGWGSCHTGALIAAREALTDWELEMGEILWRSEEWAERALEWRSQHAFAREVFHSTEADDLLAGFEDEEMDGEFHERAEAWAFSPPDYVPSSHTWW